MDQLINRTPIARAWSTLGTSMLGTSTLSGALALTIAFTCCSRLARAEGPLSANGTPITTSDYSIDLYQGTVLAGTRVIGLAGSYVAIAEDVDGNLQNPASPANRPFYSNTFFDWWLGLGVTFPTSVTNTDFFNSGARTELQNADSEVLFFTPAVNLQWGPWGLGTSLEVSTYDLTRPDSSGVSRLRAIFNVAHVQLARGFSDGQLVLGLGNRILTMNLEGRASQSGLFTSTGGGLEAGLLYRPHNQPYRFGAAFRSPIETHPEFSKELPANDDGDIVVEGDSGIPIYVPSQVSLPWDANIGVAVQFGSRPFNLGWQREDPALERADAQFERKEQARKETLRAELDKAQTRTQRRIARQKSRVTKAANRDEMRQARRRSYFRHQAELARMPKRYLLLSMSVVATGKSRDAVGVESFLHQEVRRSGETISVSPRVGLESEVVPNWLKLRGGSYYEPPRLVDSQGRVHGTAGLDFKLIRWNVFGIGPEDYLWKLGLSVDAAERYFAWGFMVGGWYPRHGSDD